LKYYRVEDPEYYRSYHHYWKYFVCKCNIATDPIRSEYAVGDIWAGGVSLDTGNGETNSTKRDDWRHTLPACKFKDSNHRIIGTRNWRTPNKAVVEKLHLNLLRVNKQVYAEAKTIPYTTNIFAFDDVRAFRRFVSKETGLSPTQLALIQNLSIHINPKTQEVDQWNKWLSEPPETFYALSGVKRLQIAVDNEQPWRSDLRDKDGAWSDLFHVYGFLAFTRLGIGQVSVDLSLCQAQRVTWAKVEDEAAFRVREEEMDGEKAAYAKMLEGKLNTPWSEIEEEMKALKNEYNAIMGGRYWSGIHW
jgi:hypothetical protein